MKKRTWFYATAAAVAALALVVWAFAPRPVEVEVATATSGPFETTIDEDAKTRLRDRYVVSAPLAGLLSRVDLREGDPVEANAVVATLTSVLSPMLDERTMREQRLRVEIAEAQVERVDARIERAKVAVLQAANEVRRSEQLAAQGFVASTKPWLETLRRLESLPFTTLIPGHGKVQRDRKYLATLEWSMRDLVTHANAAAAAGKTKEEAFKSFDQKAEQARFGARDAWTKKWLSDYWLEGTFETAFDDRFGRLLEERWGGFFCGGLGNGLGGLGFFCDSLEERPDL